MGSWRKPASALAPGALAAVVPMAISGPPMATEVRQWLLDAAGPAELRRRRRLRLGLERLSLLALAGDFGLQARNASAQSAAGGARTLGAGVAKLSDTRHGHDAHDAFTRRRYHVRREIPSASHG